MTKTRALRSNFIACLMAVVLMFCALGTGSVVAQMHLCTVALQTAESTLVCPGAGEFFTGSLPPQESQSVRELSTDWQSIVSLRPGRLARAWNSSREMQICSFLPESLRKVTFYRNHSITEGGAPTAHDTEVVVCYIHNKDGAKG